MHVVRLATSVLVLEAFLSFRVFHSSGQLGAVFLRLHLPSLQLCRAAGTSVSLLPRGVRCSAKIRQYRQQRRVYCWALEPDRGEQDWRDFRARLVERDKQQRQLRGGSDESSPEASGLEAGGWAYPTPLIEAGTVLIAQPGGHFSIKQPYFNKALILIVEHDSDSTWGVILNRPTAISTAQLGIPGSAWPVWFGGDCQGIKYDDQTLERLSTFCLHTSESLAEYSTEVLPGIYMVGLDIAREVVRLGWATQYDFMTLVGYCGWGQGQLQAELEQRPFWAAAAVDTRVLGREVLQAARMPRWKRASEVSLDDGMGLWRRLYAALGDTYRSRLDCWWWRPDEWIGDFRLVLWIEERLAKWRRPPLA
mmetsp:Transcript_169708/g.544631  ORF Transcript_169708/g.544631 Transcript_169708/m.544631 type:complete len:364 (-) Transcript_169708:179-1270(-)